MHFFSGCLKSMAATLLTTLILSKPASFAPNITARNTRWPETIPWTDVCGQRRSINSAESGHGGRRLMRLLASKAADPTEVSELAASLAARLTRDLVAREVLCDATRPCTVSVSPPPKTREHQQLRARICLPSIAAAEAATAMVCEPYGEMWQQLGGEAHLFHSSRSKYKLAIRGDRRYNGSIDGAFASPACATFELRPLARWWLRLRSSSPFLNASALTASRRNGNLAQGWPLQGKQSKGAATSTAKQLADSSFAAAFAAWLASSSSAASTRTHRPLGYRSCAVVGSGHDLRCGQARGAEIDGRHEAVFRSNAAQHAPEVGGFSKGARAQSVKPRTHTARTSRVPCARRRPAQAARA